MNTSDRSIGELDVLKAGGRESFIPFVFFSILCHILTLVALRRVALPGRDRTFTSALKRPRATVMLVPVRVRPKILVDTEGLPKRTKPDERTNLISPRETRSSDPRGSEDASTGLPLLEGTTKALSLGLRKLPVPAAPKASRPASNKPGRSSNSKTPDRRATASTRAKPQEAKAPRRAGSSEAMPSKEVRPADFKEPLLAPRPHLRKEPTHRLGPKPATERSQGDAKPAVKVKTTPGKGSAPPRTKKDATKPKPPATQPAAAEPPAAGPAVLVTGLGRDPSPMKRHEKSYSSKGPAISLATNKHDYAQYLKKVRTKIQLLWILGFAMDPRLNYHTKDGKPVIIDFAIAPDGTLSDVKIHDEAGNSYLAGALKTNIMDAAPFPLFKNHGIREKNIQIRYVFYVN